MKHATVSRLTALSNHVTREAQPCVYTSEINRQPGVVATVKAAQITSGLTRLERAQEVKNILALARLQTIEMFDDFTCLAIFALMGFDNLDQIGGPPIVEEKDALPDAPQRSRSELIGPGAALSDAVGETSTHVVDEEVREKIRSLIGKRGTGDL